MKKIIFTAALPAGVVFAQSGRYFDLVFAALDSTKDVVYGRAVKWDGDTIDLHADVFEPSGDVETARPLPIFIFTAAGFWKGRRPTKRWCGFVVRWLGEAMLPLR